jgi:predicted AlkP superfamily pyrophosphatase or phosphodiesterase
VILFPAGRAWRTGAWPVLLLACSAAAQPLQRAVIVDIDGVRRDTFETAFGDGRLPAFARIFGSALWFDNASTVLPSVTMAGQASIFTGAPPARHGMVGNQWFDRRAGRIVDYMTVPGAICVYGITWFDGDACKGGLGNGHLMAPTVYEAAAAAGFTSIVVYSQYWKGASNPAPPSLLEAFRFLMGGSVEYRAFDDSMAARAVAELKARGLPSILTLYFAGADGIAHGDGISSQIPYLSGVIDPLLGGILDTIEALDPAWRDSTLFVLTSDHGRTDALPYPEDRFLMADLIAALPSGAVVAENGGMAYVYFDAPVEELATLAASLAQDSRLRSTVASVLVRRAEDSPRSGDLVVTLQSGHYFGNSGTGSHHGGVFSGDLIVPLLLAGPGIGAGHLAVPVSITQVARTVAEYLGFAMDSADDALPIPRAVHRKGFVPTVTNPR